MMKCVRLLRFPGCQGTQGGEPKVKRALRKAIFSSRQTMPDLIGPPHRYLWRATASVAKPKQVL